jgi:hypothetical protein
MPDRRPGTYRVKAEGTFKGVWGKYGDEVTKEGLYADTVSPFSGRRWATNEMVMEVH